MIYFQKLSQKTQKLLLVSILLPPLLFVLASLLLLLYTFLPVPLTIPSLPESTRLTILAHGIYDTPDTWSRDMAQLIERNEGSASDNPAVALNWNKYARSVFRCSVNGLRLGKKIGSQLVAEGSIKALHLIGHSCGSFVVYGICRGLKEEGADVMVQTTYLDPVSNYGGVYSSFGIKHFGSCADFSDAYIDTGDNVPGSNQLLPQTHTFDVTRIRKQTAQGANPHLWPVEFYRRQVKTNQYPLLRRDEQVTQKYPRGILETL